MQQRDQSIETLRGLAIVLLVMSHVIGGMNSISHGGELPLIKYVNDILHPLRVPLFTVISGYVYSLRPVQKDKINKFLYGKSRRLLIPLITVGTGYYIMQSLIPGVNNPTKLDFSIFKIYFFNYLHLWYLHALFLVFLTIIVVEYFDLLNNFKGFLITFFASWVCQIILVPILNDYPPFTTFFGLAGYLSLLPFFLLGVGFYRYNKELQSVASKWVYFITFIVSFSILQLSLFESVNFEFAQYRILRLFIGCSGIGLLIYFRRTNIYLANLGGYSFSIYLFHVLGSAGTRICMGFLGIEQPLIIFLGSWIGGLLIPIIMERTFERSSYTRYLFLRKRFSIA